MPNEFKIEGLEELREKLEGLGAIAGQKVVASAARAAMQPVLDEAVRLVPKKTGLLAKTLRLTATKPKSGDIVASAGIAMRAKVKDEIPVEEGFQGPAIVYTVVSNDPVPTVDGASFLRHSIVQIDCYSFEYDLSHAVADAVEAALSGYDVPAVVSVTLESTRDVSEEGVTQYQRVMIQFSIWGGDK